MHYFSKSKLGFYSKQLKSLYESQNSWPNDAKLIDYSVYEEYGLSPAPSGKKLSADFNGDPCWVDYEASQEDLIFLESTWISSELLRAEEELNKVQDSDPKAFGSVSDWRAYRRSLRIWPENESFPNKIFRPKAPDYKE